MTTCTGDFQPYIHKGTISFPVRGQTATLTVYRDGNGDGFLALRLPEQRATSYGRRGYLDLVPGDHHRFLMDFNYAYNP